jgi:hypothetical protein
MMTEEQYLRERTIFFESLIVGLIAGFGFGMATAYCLLHLGW